MPDQKPNAENPEKFTGLKLSKPQTNAAGIAGILEAAKQVFGEMDIARGLKALAGLNQKDGYDCPGCAWPDPDDDRSSIAEYCENGAKAIAEEATSKKLTAKFFEENSVASLATLNDYEIGRKGRIAQPMYLPKAATHYQPITWEEAFSKIAVHLRQLASPDEAIFYTSGRTSNEAAFLYQLFVREFGTNNLPDCSNMCHESSGVALNESLGIGKGSVTLEDFYEAEVIIILGQNPGTNHPRMLTALQKAKRNGAKIISVNPLPEAGLTSFSNPQQVKGILGVKTALTDLFLPVKINGDMALLQCINYYLLRAENENPGTILHQDFIANNTNDFHAYKEHIEQVPVEHYLELAGISREQLMEAVDILKHKSRIIACWAMGLTQHKNAVDTIKEIVNLLLMKGSIGKPGAGTCPVRGHSNVQGDRTMGIYEKPPQSLLDNIHKVFGFDPPRHDGYDVVDSITAMHKGKAKVFFAMGGNFLSATPDTHFTAEALRRCKLTVQVSTKLNRSHLVHGEEALILPCLGRSDKDMLNGELQFVSCENSMGVVQMSKGSLKPVSENLKSEPLIVCELAMAVLEKRSKIDWQKYLQHYDEIRKDIEKTIPGFDDYNVKVRRPAGFYLPNCNRSGWFNTESQKANFNIAFPLVHRLNDDELMMMTIRSHDQFNTTIYGLNDRYRGVKNERRVIFMNRKDLNNRTLKTGDVVDVFSNADGTERVARKFIAVEYPIPVQCTAMYFPEANVLVPIGLVAEKSNTPVSKSVPITVQRSKD